MSEEGGYPRETRVDSCALTSVRRVAAMLDADPKGLGAGDPLPLGWHFFLLGGETRRSSLREDGFPGFGVPMPDLGLPRLLLGGRTVSYLGDIEIGSEVERTSFVSSITERQTASGRMAIVKIHHELRPFSAARPAIVETQTYLLLGAKGAKKPAEGDHPPIVAEHRKTVVPDQTLLFQYSALGFNSHRIHLDRDYARDVEGLPDLVVNGGLTTLLLTEFLRTDLGLTPKNIKTRHSAPLYCGRPITLAAKRDDAGCRLWAQDDTNAVAVEVEADVQ